MLANAPSPVARTATLRRGIAVVGPGALVAVGYVDPGNWATDIAGGSRYAYALLSVVVACGLVAMLFQSMSARLGIATGRDLAALTRELQPRAAWIMWAGAELAVIATDLAEVLGSALALKLLFGVPLLAGVMLTALDVTVLFALDRGGSRWMERFVASLVVLVGAGLGYELLLSRFDVAQAIAGLVPSAELGRDPEMLLMAVGILGATIMPHNLYLHSSLVQSHRSGDARADARRATVDTVASLAVAMVLNAALVVLAASVFHGHGRQDVASIEDAHRLLAPLLGSTLAPAVFALTLLAAGQSATITGTMAGQVIMSGLLQLRWPAWQRRLATRACAIVPAVIVLAWSGESSTSRLLVISQVVLSIQLPFALVPLMRLTSDARRMGALVNTRWMKVAGWSSVAVIVAANAALVVLQYKP